MDTNLSESVLWRISQLADRMAASGRIPAPAALVDALMGAMELSEKTKLARPDYALPFGAKAGTRVGRGLAGGINKARVVGNYFVKQVTEHGSPHAEEAAGQLREHLGLPSIKIRRAEGPKGEHYMFTDYDPSTRPLSQLDAEDLKPKEVVHNLLADYLTADKDRHDQNYVHQRGRGLVSIDHGAAFHPENEVWSFYNDRPGEEPSDSSSLVSTPELGTHPLEESELHERYTGPRDVEADPQVVTKAAGIQHERHLLGLAWAGTEGLPQAERLAAVRAMQHRIRGLRDAIKANGGKVNLNTLRQAEMFALKRITGER